MSAASSHPRLERWLDHLAGALDPEERRELDVHRAGCEACTREFEMLSGVRACVTEPAIPTVPKRVAEKIRSLPAREARAKSASPARSVRWRPSDVRATVTALPSLVATRSTPEAEISVVARPPEGDGEWRFDGRVWLNEPDAGQIHIVLAHEDHVLAVKDVADGESFRLTEIVGPAWQLEIHLPNGTVHIIEDPRR